jgi:hypothetical protein
MTQIYYWKRVLLSIYYDNLITSKYHRFSALFGLKEFDLSFYNSVLTALLFKGSRGRTKMEKVPRPVSVKVSLTEPIYDGARLRVVHVRDDFHRRPEQDMFFWVPGQGLDQ